MMPTLGTRPTLRSEITWTCSETFAIALSLMSGSADGCCAERRTPRLAPEASVANATDRCRLDRCMTTPARDSSRTMVSSQKGNAMADDTNTLPERVQVVEEK